MTDKNVKVEVLEKEYLGKAKGIYASIQEHLSPEYRKQYSMRRFGGCLLLFLFLRYMLETSDLGLISLNSIFPLVYTVIAWIFWHYSFWRFQGGIIDTFSRNMIYFGSIWSLIWKMVVQNIIILTWIAFIAPFSGIKTWRKAVKYNKTLLIDSSQNDPWK